MHRRITGLMRDAWYLVAIVLISGILMWIFLAWWAGASVILLSLITFAYFGLVRYDDEGNERMDSRA